MIPFTIEIISYTSIICMILVYMIPLTMSSLRGKIVITSTLCRLKTTTRNIFPNIDVNIMYGLNLDLHRRFAIAQCDM
jgi:hypothetical protein